MKQQVVLCVDDEPSVLAGLRRTLHGHHHVLTAEGGAEGLAILEDRSDIVVVVSDMRMPNMSGAEFLAKARLGWPDVVRVLLTGQSDIDSAIAAVNDGQIFRFLSKPTTTEQLLASLAQAAEHHRLISAERELTQGTVRGLVEVLVDVLEMVNPVAHATVGRHVLQVVALAAELDVPDVWEFEVAAMLSMIGGVAVPDEVLLRSRRGGNLTPGERKSVASIPELGASLIKRIPRMEDIAEMVRLQRTDLHDRWAEQPPSRIVLGAGLLKTAAAMETARATSVSDAAARGAVLAMPGMHHPKVIQALCALDASSPAVVTESKRMVHLADLREGMVLDDDLIDGTGTLLVSAGQILTRPLIIRVLRFNEIRQLPRQLRVLEHSDPLGAS